MHTITYYKPVLSAPRGIITSAYFLVYKQYKTADTRATRHAQHFTDESVAASLFSRV